MSSYFGDNLRPVQQQLLVAGSGIRILCQVVRFTQLIAHLSPKLKCHLVCPLHCSSCKRTNARACGVRTNGETLHPISFFSSFLFKVSARPESLLLFQLLCSSFANCNKCSEVSQLTRGFFTQCYHWETYGLVIKHHLQVSANHFSI